MLTRSDTYCFSAAPCSLDLQTTVSYYYFKLDKDLNHAGLRTGFCGRDLIHESLDTLLHFNSQQRNKFLYFCSTFVNIVFLFINISTLHKILLNNKAALSLDSVNLPLFICDLVTSDWLIYSFYFSYLSLVNLRLLLMGKSICWPFVDGRHQ